MENKKSHILIIDDDPMISRLFGAKLAENGYEVMYSQNGNDAREMARRFQPDLILLDIRMSTATEGWDIAERLKNERQTKDIPIIFLTNEDFTPEAEKAAKELWVVDYIHKSTDLNEFVDRVQKAVPSKSE